MTLKIKRAKIDPATPPAAPAAPAAATAPTDAARRVRPLVTPRAPASSKNRTRVLLEALDGKIAWEKMSPDAKKALEDLFRNPEFLKQYGLTGREKAFEPEQVKMLYDGISMMYSSVVGFFLRWPAPALKMLCYTDEQKDMLATPTANLANKFAPVFLRDHQELIVWLSVFGAITQKNFMLAKEEAARLATQKPTMITRAPVVPGRPAAPAAPAGISRPPVATRTAPADRPAPTIEVPFSIPSEMSAAASLADEMPAAGEGESLDD